MDEAASSVAEDGLRQMERDLAGANVEEDPFQQHDHVRDAYLEYPEKKRFKAMGPASIAQGARRRRDETMVQYVSRKRTLRNGSN